MLEIRDLAPLIAPFMAAGGVLTQELVRARGQHNKRQQARNEAAEMMAFLEKWIKTQELACSPEEFEQVKQIARQQLYDIHATLARLQKTQSQEAETRPLLQRALLLYRPAGFSGWVARTIIYSILIIVGFFSIGIFADFKTEDIGAAIAFYIVCLIVILPLHAWAVSDDKHRQPQRA
jgi:hypothetical protein